MICNVNSSLLPDWEDFNNQAANGNACVVDYSKNLMDIARKETCGTCVFCREGTWQAYEIIKDITEGNAHSDDFELLMDILENMAKGASCEMTKTASERVIKLMKMHEDEWDMHIRRKRCTNLVCKGTFTLYVDPLLCDGCGKCLNSCPHLAITGGEGMIHMINTEVCQKSMTCLSVCPKGAIMKAGQMKPKLPDKLVPVGSFQRSEDGTGRRRRRRG